MPNNYYTLYVTYFPNCAKNINALLRSAYLEVDPLLYVVYLFRLPRQTNPKCMQMRPKYNWQMALGFDGH